METEGDYCHGGYALFRQLVPRGVTRAPMARLRPDLPPGPVILLEKTKSEILRGPAFEICGTAFPSFASFLWALTP